MWGFRSSDKKKDLVSNLPSRGPTHGGPPEAASAPVVSSHSSNPFTLGSSSPSSVRPFDKTAFRHAKNCISCFCLTRDGSEVITGGYDGVIHRRSLSSPVRPRRSVRAHEHVRCLCLTADERYLFTGGSDNCVRLYRYPSLRIIQTFKTKSRVFCLHVNRKVPLSPLLFAGCYTGRICAWNSSNGNILTPFKSCPKQHDRVVLCLRGFGKNTFLSGSEDRTVKQWNVRNGQMIAVVNFPYRISNIDVVNFEGKNKFLFQHHIHAELHSLRPIRGRGGGRNRGRTGGGGAGAAGATGTGGSASDFSLDSPSEGVAGGGGGGGGAGSSDSVAALESDEIVSISRLQKDHMFLSMTEFRVIHERVLVGWNQLLGRLEFWDIGRRALMFHKRIPEAVFCRNFVCVQWGAVQVSECDESGTVLGGGAGRRRGSLGRTGSLRGGSPSDVGVGGIPTGGSLRRERTLPSGGGIVGVGRDRPRDRGSRTVGGVSFVYYVVGRDLDRVEVSRDDLLRKQERSSVYEARQAYLGYRELFAYFTRTLSFAPVVVAQAIEDAVALKKITPALTVSAQIGRLMESLSNEDEGDQSAGACSQHPMMPNIAASTDELDMVRRVAEFSRIAVPNSQGINVYGGGAATSAAALAGKSFRDRRNLFFNKVFEHLPPDSSGARFTLLIRRSDLFADTLMAYLKDSFIQKVQLTTVQISLAAGLKIETAKRDEFFKLVVTEMVDQMFVPLEGTQSRPYFNVCPDSPLLELEDVSIDQLYRAAGRILGHCLYHRIQVPFHLPVAVYKALVGIPLELSDLPGPFPALASEFDRMLLRFDERAEETTLAQGLLWVDSVTGSELVSGGRGLEVSYDEIPAYCRQVAEFRLIERVEAFVKAFVDGFNDVIAMDYFSLFPDPSEIEVLLCGHSRVDVAAWERSVIYSNCSADSDVCKWFFEIIREDLDLEDQAKLLFLVTGEYSIPAEGFSPVAMISRVDLKNLYEEERELKINPVFNTLELPSYGERELLLGGIRALLEKHSGVRL